MNKVLSFLEDHVEKMVLGIVLIVSLWLLVTRVVLSPNAISYDRLDNHTPGNIDDYIRDQARKLEDVGNQPPTRLGVYQPRLGQYREILNSSVTGVDFSVSPPVPENNPQGATVVRKYNLPDVGQVGDVIVGHIRAVAYTPFQEVTVDRGSNYTGSNSEPNDLDFVTVQGKYDIAALYASFADSFAGAEVKPEWRDPCLAEPVFAAVHLQRQKKGYDGLWEQWQDVPKTKVNPRRGLFTVIEDARSLPPGGLTVRMLQYSDRQVQIDLLQPASYSIASANEEWFPPRLYKEYVAVRAAEALEERRRLKEEEGDRSGDGESSSRRRTSSSGRRSQGDIGGRTSSLSAGQSRGRTSSGRRSRSGAASGARQPQETGRGRTSRSRTGRDVTQAYSTTEARRDARPTVEDVRQKMGEFAIMPYTDLHQLAELVFWAHDDGVEPGAEYRYRVRIGVFNPVAGKNQLSQRDATRNNEVMLWSTFSTLSRTVKIPRRLYFFAKGIQPAAKEVTIQVSKYMLGYWYSEDFKVKGGEVIGDIVKTKVAKEPVASVVQPIYSPDDSANDQPEMIDYDTGAVLVDVVQVNDFSGDKTLRPRNYYDMLFSYDATRIERMPVGDRYWPDDLRVMRSEIRNAQREPKQPFRAFTDKRKEAMQAATLRASSRFRDDDL